MRLLIKNIGILAGIAEAGRERVMGAAMKELRTIENAWLAADDGLITGFGNMEELPSEQADNVVNAFGGVVLPAAP